MDTSFPRFRMGVLAGLSGMIALSAWPLVAPPVQASTERSCLDMLARGDAHGTHSPVTEAYFGLVDAYRRSSLDEALAGLAEFPRASLQQVFDALADNADEARRAAAGEIQFNDDCLLAASMLHTDAAIASAESGAWSNAKTDLDLALSFIQSTENPSTQRDFARDWLLANAYFYQGSIFMRNPEIGFSEAELYFREAIRIAPKDALVLLSAGTLREWAGSLRYGNDDDLEDAANLYKRAIEEDSSLFEAHVRLARIQEKTGSYSDAIKTLNAASALSGTPFTEAIGHLLHGRLDERDNRLDSAIAHYQEAKKRQPRWQVIDVALSHAMHLSGARAESRELLERSFDPHLASAEAIEGWWRYEIGLIDELPDLMDKMRKRVQR